LTISGKEYPGGKTTQAAAVVPIIGTRYLLEVKQHKQRE